MKDLALHIVKNIKTGVKTTLLGIALFLFGGWMVYTTYKSDAALEWASVEVGIFVIGLYFCVVGDNLLLTKNEDTE